MLKKKQRIKGTVIGLNANGLGMIKSGHDTVSVKQVIVDEQVEVVIDKKVKEGYYGFVSKILKPSSKRCKTGCGAFSRCGSCEYLYLLYPFELKYKTDYVKRLTNEYKLKLEVDN